MLFLHALQVCILLTVTLTVKSYVLFSANLEDFKYLAQKFVPENLAVKLTELVSESSKDKRQDRDGGDQRKTATDNDTPWKMANKNIYIERNTEWNEVHTVGLRTLQTNTESYFEPDRMHEKDYDRLQDTTYPRIMSKRYKTVQRMATTKDWFEEPPSFLKSMYPKNEEPDTPSHSIYYKQKDTNEGVKSNSPERDINYNYERNKEKEDIKMERNEKNDGKQMMQYFPVENRPLRIKKKINNETEKVRVNGRDISKIKPRKVKKLENKGKDDAMIFDTVMMSKKKDSYEDYVTPKKDEDYLINDRFDPTKKKPTPTTEKGSNDGISPFGINWPLMPVQKDNERGRGSTPFAKKEPNWSAVKDSKYEIAPTTRKLPDWSVERDVRGIITKTTKERPTWSEQRNIFDGFPQQTKKPPLISIQRQRSEKTTITTEETFPDYIERDWMTTERKTSPTENKWMVREKYTTGKENTTEYFGHGKKNDEMPLDYDQPLYKEKEAIKARTESILFNSKELDDNKTSATKFTMKGTGMPTREYYKISTPDYYKKLPRIVEKYDFNEPIPEADREREKIDDRFIKEPARVNHKVKQQEKVGPSENRHREKAGPLGKRNQERAGPLESILENIGFRFKAVTGVTESEDE